MSKDLLTFSHYSPAQMRELVDLAHSVKHQAHNYANVLAGKSIAGLFEKPSLRTRVSFDVGINKLGGHFIYLDSQKERLGARESLADMAANLACWCDAIVARVFEHNTLSVMSEATDIPVINALCDLYHPCQALADFLSIKEILGDVQGAHLAYVGDGNNVTHSLLIVGALLGCHISVCTPEGHEVDPTIFAHAKQLAGQTGARLMQTNDIADLQEVQFIYADTWISMGDDAKPAEIKQRFAPYQVNHAMMARTGAAYVMHCQPAHRDVEITSALMDSEHSALLRQAENRMHAQNAILIKLLA